MIPHGGAATALKRVVELQLEVARLAVAREQRCVTEQQAALRDALQVQRLGAESGAALLQRGWAAVMHARVLRHLAVLGEQRARMASGAATAEANLADATRHTLDLDRCRAVLERLERRRELVRARDEEHAASREADLQWLVNAAVRRALAQRGGDAA